MQPFDILILSNGPGELVTWVRPVVKELRQQLRQQLGGNGSTVRISVVLSPCTHATGQEAAIARKYPEVDRVQGAADFWPFLLWGKTAENWDWYPQGVVVFLGGDQFFTVVIGKRLGYSTVVYAEWEARWQGWIDRFGVMNQSILERVNPKYAAKFTVVGDLIADLPRQIDRTNQELLINADRHDEIIALMPGSKAAKLSQGVPLTLAIAEKIHGSRPQTRFIIPVAPTLDLITLAKYADPEQNPVIFPRGLAAAQLKTDNLNIAYLNIEIQAKIENYYLETSTGLRVDLYTETPAYNLLSQCALCLTTVGANTAELGALAVPAIVLLPTQQLDAMRAWDGIPGLLANLPGFGSYFAKLINWWVLRKKQLYAWPNIWAKEEVIPELVGQLTPEFVANIALDLLANPEKLAEMRSRLRSLRGETGAAQKFAQLILDCTGKA
ncbi:MULTISPECIES: lipid-A-disaccharide synthase [Planktothricoides]|uniref:Lipid-A-disaccharide synthase n=2 Tax=Planktothricoides raciborskii TaxID=132608 RepID=A0AAU8JBN3_9CYAN|nr:MULTISPECIES: lipid-A-disaccharide synthase [Planktothricoides]KOR38473.1 lipid-A-disaccharide synthase [Planktothricoides sp. SR001]MBD2544574.1 lipid-A-disaccharide synthase [Planktothricoides raciborskii FACHB-1370]MBD2583519.1 lipid-A-disaccharide synthase [Planktothricoides raciborskii FACHB-1261]